MNLIVLLLIPLITSLGILLSRGIIQIRVISLLGAMLQLAAGLFLLAMYWSERSSGNNAQMLFESSYAWFAPLHINFHIGVDGISIAMILLTAFVVLSGILVSWKEETMSKEFFFLLIFLSLGAYGFFISLDLFTMFFFLEVAVIPKFLLIGIWGSGKKEYSAMKLALMLMGGSALVLVGLLGLYFNTNTGNGSHTFDLLQIAAMNIPIEAQRISSSF